MQKKTVELSTKSKFYFPETSIELLDKSFWFILKFFMYDDFTQHGDYVVAPAFEKVYSSTESIIVMFPN